MRAAFPPLLIALLLGACSGGPAPWSVDEPDDPGPYELLDAATRGRLRAVVTAYEEGDLERAQTGIAELDRWWAEDIHVAIWKQEIALAVGLKEASGEGGGESAGESPLKKLRSRYRQQAEQDPDPLKWVLAARVEDDTHAACLLLERALELDPTFSWAHYGLAHAHARAGEIPEALEALRITFEHDPDNLPALRLYGWCVAQGGDPDRAVDAFETWLELADQDLLATRRTRSVVVLDLALVHLSADRPERAEELIDTLREDDVDEVRRLAASAAAAQAQGHPRTALATAESALEHDPNAMLPAVQRALILELWLGDVEGARSAWRRVLEIAAGRSDLGAEMQRFRAQLHLARLPRPEGIREMAR